MQGKDGFQRFAGGGFELLGVEVDEVQLSIIAIADSIYRPTIDALLAADLDEVEPEPDMELSKQPAADPAAPGRAAEDAAGS